MSSVSMHKCHGSEASAYLAHATRHDDREGVVYDNKHVNPALSYQNYEVGRGRFEQAETSAQARARLKARLEQIDKRLPPKRVRKDRVTSVSYVITAPEGLAPAQEKRFFEIAYRALAQWSGGRENISHGYIHKDEIHEYYDRNGQKRTSRAHMHAQGLPYVEGKGINGNLFLKRDRMKELNEEIDHACREELGVPFMTREREAVGRDTEELKIESAERADAILRAKQSQIEAQTAQLAHIQELARTAERQRRDAVKEAHSVSERVAEATARLEDVKAQAKIAEAHIVEMAANQPYTNTNDFMELIGLRHDRDMLRGIAPSWFKADGRLSHTIVREVFGIEEPTRHRGRQFDDFEPDFP